MSGRSLRAAAIATALLALLYVGIVWAASGSFQHVVDQVGRDWYYLALILGGFGVQVALVSELRRRNRRFGALVTAFANRRRGRRRRALAVMVALVGVAGLVPVLGGCRSATSSADGAAPNFGVERTIEAGSVTVKLQLRQLDVDGAVFEIIFDTHPAEGVATLSIDGLPEPVVTTWDIGS